MKISKKTLLAALASTLMLCGNAFAADYNSGTTSLGSGTTNTVNVRGTAIVNNYSAILGTKLAAGTITNANVYGGTLNNEMGPANTTTGRVVNLYMSGGTTNNSAEITDATIEGEAKLYNNAITLNDAIKNASVGLININLGEFGTLAVGGGLVKDATVSAGGTLKNAGTRANIKAGISLNLNNSGVTHVKVDGGNFENSGYTGNMELISGSATNTGMRFSGKLSENISGEIASGIDIANVSGGSYNSSGYTGTLNLSGGEATNGSIGIHGNLLGVQTSLGGGIIEANVSGGKLENIGGSINVANVSGNGTLINNHTNLNSLPDWLGSVVGGATGGLGDMSWLGDVAGLLGGSDFSILPGVSTFNISGNGTLENNGFITNVYDLLNGGTTKNTVRGGTLSNNGILMGSTDATGGEIANNSGAFAVGQFALSGDAKLVNAGIMTGLDLSNIGDIIGVIGDGGDLSAIGSIIGGITGDGGFDLGNIDFSNIAGILSSLDSLADIGGTALTLADNASAVNTGQILGAVDVKGNATLDNSGLPLGIIAKVNVGENGVVNNGSIVLSANTEDNGTFNNNGFTSQIDLSQINTDGLGDVVAGLGDAVGGLGDISLDNIGDILGGLGGSLDGLGNIFGDMSNLSEGIVLNANVNGGNFNNKDGALVLNATVTDGKLNNSNLGIIVGAEVIGGELNNSALGVVVDATAKKGGTVNNSDLGIIITANAEAGGIVNNSAAGIVTANVNGGTVNNSNLGVIGMATVNDGLLNNHDGGIVASLDVNGGKVVNSDLGVLAVANVNDGKVVNKDGGIIASLNANGGTVVNKDLGVIAAANVKDGGKVINKDNGIIAYANVDGGRVDNKDNSVIASMDMSGGVVNNQANPTQRQLLVDTVGKIKENVKSGNNLFDGIANDLKVGGIGYVNQTGGTLNNGALGVIADADYRGGSFVNNGTVFNANIFGNELSGNGFFGDMDVKAGGSINTSDFTGFIADFTLEAGATAYFAILDYCCLTNELDLPIYNTFVNAGKVTLENGSYLDMVFGSDFFEDWSADDKERIFDMSALFSTEFLCFESIDNWDNLEYLVTADYDWYQEGSNIIFTRGEGDQGGSSIDPPATTTPEPATLLILGAAGFAVPVIRRRFAKKA